MRIIAGQAGGIPLKVPAGDTRPTTDRVREALFSMLGDLVENATVLDLFAGSGSLGLESLSRGAQSAVFVEQNRQASEIIRANLQKTRLNGAEIRQNDVFKTLTALSREGRTFDLIFADPPYQHRASDTDFTQELLTAPALSELLKPDALLILECLAGPCDTVIPIGWSMIRSKDYGTTRLLWLKKELSPSSAT